MSTQAEIPRGPVTVSEIQSLKFPTAFFDTLVDDLSTVLEDQREDGRIWRDGVWNQKVWASQSVILPMAFCLTTGDSKWRNSAVLRDSIRKLTRFLERATNDQGEFTIESGKSEVRILNQRFLYPWIEALRMLRDAKEDFPFDVWEKKLIGGCENLIEHRIRHAVGLKHFLGRVLGTSTNHFALYLSTVYRAGMVFNRKEFCDLTLPLARALAADIHPDGYWDEHNDLSREIGPTPFYGYLTLTGMALMYEWTRESTILDALKKASSFYSKFCYPDGTYVDLLDERVRYHHHSDPILWGLFGLTHTAVGRGVAASQFVTWLKCPFEKGFYETLGRICENYMYWHEGEVEIPPFMTESHRARLSMPGGIYRKSAWCLGLSGMKANVPHDLAYQENAFALERQKLFSVWHSKHGLLIDGSHSKGQPENSTFSTFVNKHWDYWPIAGSIDDGEDAFSARATYRTFTAAATLKVVSERELEMQFEADFSALYANVLASFTLFRVAEEIVGENGKRWRLGDERFELTSMDFGKHFSYGPMTFTGLEGMKVCWPFKPYESYTEDQQSPKDAWIVRVAIPLTPKNPRCTISLVAEV